jgi:hypothetical protein
MRVSLNPTKAFKEYMGGWLSVGVMALGLVAPVSASHGGIGQDGLPDSLAPSTLLAQRESIAGTYRCWSFNVGGAGRRCTSPPIVLHPDGTYEISSEWGTYSVLGDQVVLSESKIRGPGRLQGGNQIVFEYEYRGLPHTVTYVRQEDAPAPPGSTAK